MKLNVGCGAFPLDGYVNIDAYTDADVKADVFTLDYDDVEEIRADHFLEHVPHIAVPALLAKWHSWLRPGGRLVVEVPDMKAIMQQPPWNWTQYVYGCQAHPGEYHLSGYDKGILAGKLMEAGFQQVECSAFLSKHPMRPGMPCLLAEAVA